MRRLFQEIEALRLSLAKKFSDALLMIVTGYVVSYSYYILGYTHFLHFIYNFALCVAFLFFIEPRWPKWKWIIFGSLFSLQIPIYLLINYVNYIYTSAIILTYILFSITYKMKSLWPLWPAYALFFILIHFFPGTVFYLIRGYNLIVTGNFFFWKI